MTKTLARVEEGKLVKYTYDQVKENYQNWLAEFRFNNGTNQIIAKGGTDRCYELYKNELDNFLKDSSMQLLNQDYIKLNIEEIE